MAREFVSRHPFNLYSRTILWLRACGAHATAVSSCFASGQYRNMTISSQKNDGKAAIVWDLELFCQMDKSGVFLIQFSLEWKRWHNLFNLFKIYLSHTHTRRSTLNQCCQHYLHATYVRWAKQSRSRIHSFRFSFQAVGTTWHLVGARERESVNGERDISLKAVWHLAQQ